MKIPSAATSTPAYPHDDPGQSSKDQSVQKGRQIAGGKHEIPAAVGGQKLAIPAVVPSNEITGDQWQTALYTHGRHDPSSSQLGRTMQEEGTIVRFHSLRPPNSQEQVIPWKLDVDVKCHEVHALIKKLAQSSLWQLVSVRIKPHSLQQSKLADQLQQALRPKRKTK